MELLGLGLGCCGVLFALAVGSLIGSVFVRAGVALANRVVGPPAPPDTFGQWDDWDSDEPAPAPRAGPTRTIPEPSLATGMMIAFVAGAVSALACVALTAVAAALDLDGPDEWAAIALYVLLWAPFTGLTLAVLLKLVLPTTFARAALAALFHHLVVGAAVVLVGGAGLLLWYATGP